MAASALRLGGLPSVSRLRALVEGLVGQQPQCVEHHEQRRPLVEDHGGSDAQAEDGRRNQHRNDAQAHPQVLLDHATRAARQAYREWKLRQVVCHQRNVGRFQRNVGAGCTHGDAHGRVGHGRCIVDAVSHHRDLPVLGPELLDLLNLLLWHQVAPSLGQTDRLGYCFGHLLVVTRDHDQALDAQLAQLGHDLSRHGPRRVHHSDHAQELAALANDHGGPPVGHELLVRLVDIRGYVGVGQLGEQHRLTDVHGLAAELRLHTPSRDALDLRRLQQVGLVSQTLLGTRHDGGRERVVAVLFHRKRHCQQFLLRHPLRRHDVGQLRLALGQGAGLVEGDGRQRAQVLQRAATLDQHTAACRARHAAQNGAGHGDRQSAGACSHQHGHCPIERLRERLVDDEACAEQQANQQQH
mmetsp:Transcript_60030/g.142092  ORF Transcript_60030/g.142092 Transcript_60030/m.142092 type:complete len:411 (-) Transcript_60030:189-1421(-)